MNWNRALARPVPYKNSKRGELRTLADARAYAIKRNPSWGRTLAHRGVAIVATEAGPCPLLGV